MIGAAVLIAIGILAGQFFPTSFREWVRGVAGKARGLVLGAAPAPVSEIRASAHNVDLSQSDHSPEVRPTPPNKNIQIGRALANVAGFLWRWKWAIIAALIFTLLVGLMRGCAGPLDFGKSRGQIALERELAEANAEVRKHERDLSDFATGLAERTYRDRDRAAAAVENAEQELSNAVEQDDFDAMYRAYRAGYDGPNGVWAQPSGDDRPNPAPSRSDGMHSAGAGSGREFAAYSI